MKNVWTPEEINFLYDFAMNTPTSWTKKNSYRWLEAERILTYSDELQKLHCNCQVADVKNRVITMINKARPNIIELYESTQS